MRLENTWQEIRDHSFIQNLSRSFRFTAPWRLLLFSSPHSSSTGFRSEDWNGQQKLGFVLSDPFLFFEVCVWIIVRLEDPSMAQYKISNRVSHLLIFLSVGIWSNPWCHVSKQDVQDLQQKYRPTTSKIQQYISLYTWGTFYPFVHQTHLECLLLNSSFFSFIWP